jgi:5-methyltetrahydropteroyltriglutamate--homocysteine methyltransferase
MVETHILGFPRVGPRRELKTALEAYWRGEINEAGLRRAAAERRAEAWHLQRDAGLSYVSVGDFSLYDHVLDTAFMLGALPARFGGAAAGRALTAYFGMARGTTDQPALEMTKWYDTNYHYLVPELDSGIRLNVNTAPLLEPVREAQVLGHRVKPVLFGPVSFLGLCKSTEPGWDPIALLPQAMHAYGEILGALKAQGITWVQLDEPALALPLPPAWHAAADAAYRTLSPNRPKLLLTTYFTSAAPVAGWLSTLPFDGIHLDLVRGPGALDGWLAALPASWVLSSGIVDGRNVWRNDVPASLELLGRAHRTLGNRLWIGSSCSLLHAPHDLGLEHKLDPLLKAKLAFAVQKLGEVTAIAAGLQRPERVSPSKGTRTAPPVERPGAPVLDDALTRRRSGFVARNRRQRARLGLPLLPTTTIGSFPQTGTIRAARAALKRGEIDMVAYDGAMRAEVRDAIARQERLGLDVLVHGEAERNDMVQFFAERLEGFAVTEHGWVQSYGSRCVKPPIIHEEVRRARPITVELACYAQSLTDRPVKGMLTGPVTMLQWSFARADETREVIAMQIALALRQEVSDLEAAGIRIIQIDEPAFREGLPLEREAWADYLAWATRAFRVTSCGVADETQIHTHMCYSEFNDILDALVALDADVITIETSRSRMDLLDAFAEQAYPNEIGPGVYDIHSPRTPSAEEIIELIERAVGVVPIERLWVNPDCGLKTRAWPEVETALANMVRAASQVRDRSSVT